jgi:hypothetical protein
MRAIIAVLFLAVLVCATTASAQTNIDPTKPIPDRIVIKMRSGSSQLSSVNTGYSVLWFTYSHE